MASKPGAWGIDIGQAGLKAIRLEINDATEQVVATAFDFIAHPKILSQPDAIPEELISQALEKFLKQNVIANDVIAISVPGQSALARFIQLPPVEASKVSEIVKYEARQQIPFALEDVVWDYQTLGKGTEESGFLLEAEVGLFAMKRDQVMNQLKPFTNASVEVELIQIAPLALYNFLSYDQLGIRLGDEVVAMDSYTILLDMGADNTTLLVSNGQKIWIRNVPIGGNHFTRALTKEMKLTFAKAEHLKCNATKSPDPRAVFQALRPVFNDYVSEIQRSIGYFSSVNRDAKVSKVVGLGNGFKLAGLQKFLQQNLQYEVERVESFSAISPDGFKDAALFDENILSFPVCYGIALQGLRQTRIRTSLLPKEITTARTIARKKPWAVAAAAVLLFGMAMSAVGYARVSRSVSELRFGPAQEDVKKAITEVNDFKKNYQTAKTACDTKKKEGQSLVGNLEKRTQWLELYKAINECQPRDDDKAEIMDIRKQNRVHIFSVQTRWEPELDKWFANLDAHAKASMDADDKKTPPKGGGYVVTITGEHWHDPTDGKGLSKETEQQWREGFGENYVTNYFLKPLQQWAVAAHNGSGQVGVRSIGITHAALATSPTMTQQMMDITGRTPYSRTRRNQQNYGFKRMQKMMDKGRGDGGMMQMDNLREMMENGGVVPGMNGLPGVDPKKPGEKKERLWNTQFTIQFVWNPDLPPQQPAESAAVQSPAGAVASAAAKPATTTRPK